jgi:hypothetical protein
LYAVLNGYVDTLVGNQIRDYERLLLDYADWSDLIRLLMSDIAENRDKSIDHRWILEEVFYQFNNFKNWLTFFGFKSFKDLNNVENLKSLANKLPNVYKESIFK